MWERSGSGRRKHPPHLVQAFQACCLSLRGNAMSIVLVPIAALVLGPPIVDHPVHAAAVVSVFQLSMRVVMAPSQKMDILRVGQLR